MIEPNPRDFSELISRRRKAFALPVCLSLEPYPMEVTFQAFRGRGFIKENNPSQKVGDLDENDGKLIKAQCFPLYSILLAVGRTKIDYLTLDIQGHELRVLKTLPWEKVDITVSYSLYL